MAAEVALVATELALVAAAELALLAELRAAMMQAQ